MEYSPKQNAEEFARVMRYHIRDDENPWRDRPKHRLSENDLGRRLLLEVESIVDRANISPFFKKKFIESYETGYIHFFTPLFNRYAYSHKIRRNVSDCSSILT